MKALLMVLALALMSWGAQYKVDTQQSSLTFDGKMRFGGKFEGNFSRFEGTIEISDGRPVAIDGTIEAASIHTGNPLRDTHVRSSDFLDVEKYKDIRFVSKSISGDTVTAEVTMHGITKTLPFQMKVTGVSADKITLTLSGAVARSAFKVNRHFMSALVSDQVNVTASIVAEP